jgi:16S rRNA (guanine527-N7)-methyltransferase
MLSSHRATQSKQNSQMPTAPARFEDALRANELQFGVQLDDSAVTGLREYYELVHKWNARLHLVAPCSPEEFATRHVLESLLLLPHLATGARLIDVGSGAGLPSLPCLLVRPDLQAILVESSQRKSVFLKQVLRQFDLERRATVLARRFEEIVAPRADAVSCRALDRFQNLIPALIEWAPSESTLLFFGNEVLFAEVKGILPPARMELITGAERRLLIIASRAKTS